MFLSGANVDDDDVFVPRRKHPGVKLERPVTLGRSQDAGANNGRVPTARELDEALERIRTELGLA